VLSAAVVVVIIMVKTKDMVFKPFKVTQQTVVTGGLLKKPHPVTTMSIPCVMNEFVRIDKQTEWLCCAVAGGKQSRRALCRTKLIETIKEKIASALCGEDPVEQPTDKKMAMLDFDDEDDSGPMKEAVMTEKKNTRNKGRKPVNKKNTVARVIMPELCKEAHPGNQETREVDFFVKTKKQVWMDVAHLPWLVAYMHAQYTLGGVPVVDASSAVAESDCITPPRSRIGWDFGEGAWAVTGSPGSSEKRHPEKLDPNEISAVGGNADFKTMPYIFV
jgi:hypothetical protein